MQRVARQWHGGLADHAAAVAGRKNTLGEPEGLGAKVEPVVEELVMEIPDYSDSESDDEEAFLLYEGMAINTQELADYKAKHC